MVKNPLVSWFELNRFSLDLAYSFFLHVVACDNMDSRSAKTNLKVAVVCSSNMNRSMEAHAFLKKKGFNVDSFGTGDKVGLTPRLIN